MEYLEPPPAPRGEAAARKPEPPAATRPPDSLILVGAFTRKSTGAGDQGLTLVHFSAQLESFVCGRGARRGCVARAKRVLEWCVGCVRCVGCVGCFSVSETAQVDLKSERV